MQVGPGRATRNAAWTTEVAVTIFPRRTPKGEANPRKAGDPRLAYAVLALPAIAGAVLSWKGLYDAAEDVFGRDLAVIFPLLVDTLIAGASLRWVASVRAGHPIGGWRSLTHAGVVATVGLNAYASPTLGDVPWHVAAPLVWSALVELVARDAAGRRQVEDGDNHETITLRLWLTAPIESFRAWIGLARAAERKAFAVRSVHTRRRAAVDYLRRHVSDRSARRLLVRHLEDGSLTPAALVDSIDAELDRIEAIGSDRIEGIDVDSIVRAALRSAAVGGSDRASGGSGAGSVASEVDQLAVVGSNGSSMQAIEAGANGHQPSQPAVAAAAASQTQRSTVKLPDPAHIAEGYERAMAAIQTGELTRESSAEAIRKAIKKHPKVAAAVKDHLRNGTTPDAA